jgi:hypothetical protein
VITEPAIESLVNPGPIRFRTGGLAGDDIETVRLWRRTHRRLNKSGDSRRRLGRSAFIWSSSGVELAQLDSHARHRRVTGHTTYLERFSFGLRTAEENSQWLPARWALFSRWQTMAAGCLSSFSVDTTRDRRSGPELDRESTQLSTGRSPMPSLTAPPCPPHVP